MSLQNIPAGPQVPDIINVFVEIPKGSQNKYEFDKELNVLRLDRVLFSSMMYPGDYGYVPSTLGLDGDPLDALVLVTSPTYPTTLIEARPIGVMEMVDTGESDDKILCVPVGDVRFNHVKDIGDVPEATLNEIAHFFRTYKEREGKKVDVRGWKDAAAAKVIIKSSIDAYRTQTA
jgi:inorganic pyrophosphatase